MVRKDFKEFGIKESFETWWVYTHRVGIFIEQMLYGQYS